jgi:oxygen-independent coproporphyrinogen-3 oxidase
LSTYEVIYEDDTPLFAQLHAGEFDVDEDLSCAMYDEFVERVTGAGFRQYEVANFARNRGTERNEHSTFNIQHSTPNEGGREDGHPAIQHPGTPALQHSIPSFACRHNVNYWRGGSFYGLGPSATSYVRGVRTKNRSSTPLYCEQLEAGRRAVESREELPPLRRAGETAAFGLRMNVGWAFEEFRRITGFDLRNEWAGEMEQMTARGWAARDDRRFQLTPQGLRFADAAAELFLR